MRSCVFVICFIIFSNSLVAQVSDSAKLVRESSEFSLFVDQDTLTDNDYLLTMEKIFQTMNKTSVLSQQVSPINAINNRLNEDDSALNIIKSRLSEKDKELNIRNLQMYKVILQLISKDAKNYSSQLKQYDSITDGFQKQIAILQKDSIMKQVFRTPDLRNRFKPQLVQLAQKWKKTDSLIKAVNLMIDNGLVRTSNIAITSDELLLQTNDLTASIGSRIFKKERSYLWESAKKEAGQHNLFSSEREITRYYFAHTNNKILLLLLMGIVFFFWISFNFKAITKLKKKDTLKPFGFRYIYKTPVFASLIFVLNLAPLFDLDAPFIYIATIEFFLMIVLTFSFRKRIPRDLFYLWIVFIGIFLVHSFSRYFNLPVSFNRWLLLILNGLSVGLAIYALKKYRNFYKQFRFLILAVALYGVCSFFAVVSNIFGRITLVQILGSTGTYAVIQTVGLLVFIRVVTEAVLLQIQKSRLRKKFGETFDFRTIGSGISKLVIFFAVIIWLVVFATNLNVYNFFWNNIHAQLSMDRYIGNFQFTLGGILRFVVILWAANFLQKYIPYFFGDVGDVSVFNKRSNRSGFTILRLILLVGGFLLAIAASGLAVDKITVIIGALSVGIGLGLQNIVNNFVSGIILIFDQTLHIGDTVEIGDKKGRVKQISLRSSTLLTQEGAEVIIPNGEILSKNFVNWSLGNNYIRVDVSFTIDKLIDSTEIGHAIMEAVEQYPKLLAPREPEIFNNAITSESAKLTVYFWCCEVRKREEARSVVNAAVYRKLREMEVKVIS